MARYPDYASLPAHLKEMLRLVTSDDAAAERYANAPNKNLDGRSVLQVLKAPFGQRAVERFLLDLGNYLGVEDMERFEASFGKRK
ncbi:MAG: antitoxin Xre/MbcA/ParS toxin-binding domain-containing protein [Planctomycetota bacterium]